MEGFVEQVCNLHGRHMPKLQMLNFTARSSLKLTEIPFL